MIFNAKNKLIYYRKLTDDADTIYNYETLNK
jgi:hypothetical protein